MTDYHFNLVGPLFKINEIDEINVFQGPPTGEYDTLEAGVRTLFIHLSL